MGEGCDTAVAAYCARFGRDCLVRHAGGFSEYLRQLGYSAATVEEKCRLLGHLGRWLGRREPTEVPFDEAALEAFHRSIDRPGHRRRGDVATGWQLLQYLRGLGCFPMPTPAVNRTAIDEIIADYGRFLSSERGLAPATLINYQPIIGCSRLGLGGTTCSSASCSRPIFTVSSSTTRRPRAAAEHNLRSPPCAPSCGTRGSVDKSRPTLPAPCQRSPVGRCRVCRSSCRLSRSSRCLHPVTGGRPSANATMRSCFCWPASAFAPARLSPWLLMTSTGRTVTSSSAARGKDSPVCRSRRTLAKHWSSICATSARPTGQGAFFFEYEHRCAVSPDQSASTASSLGRSNAPAWLRRSRARTCFAILWPPTCCGKVHRSPRSDNFSGTANQTPRRFTPRSTSKRCAASPSPGRQVHHEGAAGSSRRVFGVAPLPWLQVVGRVPPSPAIRGIRRRERGGVYHHGPRLDLGDPAAGRIFALLVSPAQGRPTLRPVLQRSRPANRGASSRPACSSLPAAHTLYLSRRRGRPFARRGCRIAVQDRVAASHLRHPLRAVCGHRPALPGAAATRSHRRRLAKSR